MYASYPSSVEIASKLDNALSISLRFAHIAIEFSAEVLSEVITDLSLAALESGVITRRWWEAHGRNQLRVVGWATLRTLGLMLLGLACLFCVLGFSLQLHWKAAKTLWHWVNRLTDDGLGLYGPSPLLSQWKNQFKRPSLVESPTSNFDIPALKLPGTELVAWAQLRWPQLKEINQG